MHFLTFSAISFHYHSFHLLVKLAGVKPCSIAFLHKTSRYDKKLNLKLEILF